MYAPLTVIAARAMCDGQGRTRFARRRLMVVVCLTFFAAGGVLAEEQKAGVMDAQAIDAFKSMSQRLKSAKTLRFTASAFREVADAFGINELQSRSWVVAVQRPNRFYARALRDDGREVQLWFDGASLSVAISGLKGARYAAIAAPKGAKTIDGILDHLIDEYDYVLQLGDLLYNDVYAALGDGLLSAEHLGLNLVDGRFCHHLTLEFAGADAQLWVQDGDDPVPCRWAFTLRDEPSKPFFLSTFDSWVINPSVDPARFNFVAPGGAKKMEMKDLLAQAGALD
jgi:hypothetical protein